MPWLKSFSLAAVLVGISLSSALAAPIAVEEFDYGASSTPLNGLGSAGNGFSDSWAVTGTNWTYNPTSLTFSDLSSTGGSITGLSTSGYAIGRRTFSTPLPTSSVYWGSFLSNISAQTGNFWTTSVFVGQPTDDDQQATFAMKSKDYSVAVSGAAVEGNTSALTGNNIATGTTYLNLFKADPANKSITGWLLSSAQYDNFKSGGITEIELNSALIGSAADQVFNRGTLTTVNTLDPATTLGVLNYRNLNNGTSIFDRIYFSADSLNAAISPTVVPEPSTWALLGFGAAGLFGWSRRKR